MHLLSVAFVYTLVIAILMLFITCEIILSVNEEVLNFCVSVLLTTPQETCLKLSNLYHLCLGHRIRVHKQSTILTITNLHPIWGKHYTLILWCWGHLKLFPTLVHALWHRISDFCYDPYCLWLYRFPPRGSRPVPAKGRKKKNLEKCLGVISQFDEIMFGNCFQCWYVIFDFFS